MADDVILAVRGLAAGYGGRAIVGGIDLTLHRGEVLGLLGANGSGKSTLIRAVTGQLPAMAGSVTVGGVAMAADPVAAKAKLGLAVDAPDVPAALTGRQYLELVASIRGCAPDAWPAGDMVALLQFRPWLDRPVASYSLGTRMKVSIAAALLGAPPLLIFDEALNGLDPVVAFAMKQRLGTLAAAGHAIILSTHVVETVPVVCTRALFLADGRIAGTWDSAELAAASRAPGDFERAVMAALSLHGARAA